MIVRKTFVQKSSIAVCCVLFAEILSTGSTFAIGGSGTEFGARDPGGCPSIQLDGPPSPEQVTIMLRCQHEVALDTGELWLMENVQVQVGGGVPYNEAYGSFVMPDGEIMSTAYHIRGAFTYVVCMTLADAEINGRGDTNCDIREVSDANGICWKTSFGDHRCRFLGSIISTGELTRPPQ